MKVKMKWKMAYRSHKCSQNEWNNSDLTSWLYTLLNNRQLMLKIVRIFETILSKDVVKSIVIEILDEKIRIHWQNSTENCKEFRRTSWMNSVELLKEFKNKSSSISMT